MARVLRGRLLAPGQVVTAAADLAVACDELRAGLAVQVSRLQRQSLLAGVENVDEWCDTSGRPVLLEARVALVVGLAALVAAQSAQS